MSVIDMYHKCIPSILRVVQAAFQYIHSLQDVVEKPVLLFNRLPNKSRYGKLVREIVIFLRTLPVLRHLDPDGEEIYMA